MSIVHVVILLDSSGSMQRVKDSTITLYNEQIQKIKSNAASSGVDTYVSLYVFNHNPNQVFFNESADSLQELTNESYFPNGGTALFDTMLEAITKMRKVVRIDTDDLISRCEEIMDGNDETVLFLVISDGEDADSDPGSRVKLAELVQMLSANGCWTFTYMGANQDLKKVCEDLGFNPAHVTSFTQNSVGVLDASLDMSNGLDTYYTARASGIGGQSLRAMSFYNHSDDSTTYSSQQTD